MVMLVERLEGWAITKARGDDVTVVFERPPSTAIPSSVVEVAHAPKAAANSADDEIVRLVRSGAQPQEIRVVTSDKALTDRVRDLGAAVYPAERFRDLIDPRGSNAARRTLGSGDRRRLRCAAGTAGLPRG